VRLALGEADAFVRLRSETIHPVGFVWVECEIELVIASPSDQLVRGFTSKGIPAKESAEKIFNLFSTAFDQFEGLLMTAGGVRNLLVSGRPRLQTFFRNDSLSGRDSVHWKLGNGEWKVFVPPSRGRATRNPLFKSDQLVTPQRWAKMQRAADRGDIPQEAVLELLRIRAKAAFDEKPISLIEAAIIAETIVRDFCITVLEQRGFSQNRLKNVRQDLTFNLLLNAVLPLTLSKSEIRRVSNAILQVDRLRKLRNDLVHENARDAETDAEAIRKGLDGAVRLVDFLRSRKTR
jgi:hypothetical protein